jgi:lactate dehydrogenase-like 2-hydroxyacid dehydrogenase
MAWALLLAAARRVTESERWLRAGQWKGMRFGEPLGRDVHHATLGILGMGRIGRAVARRARGFAVYAAIRSLGRDGIRAMIEGCCAQARALAEGIGALPDAGVSREHPPDGGGDANGVPGL